MFHASVSAARNISKSGLGKGQYVTDNKGKFSCRCKFLCPGLKSTPTDYNKWAKNPPDNGLPLCPAAYNLCHSPCDLLANDKKEMFEKVQGAG